MIKFEFATARRIIFGPGTLSEVAPMAAEMGDRPLLVTGRNADRAAPLLDALHSRKMKITLFQMSGEPTIDMALGAIQRARLAECDLVIGIGGGSVIDVGKVVAALITNRGELMDYLEIIGKAQPLAHAAASYIAIPTMLPHLAVVDPELTVSLPPSITAYTGLDAFTQLMEAFVSRQANPMTDGICQEGLRRAAGSLQRAFENGSDRSARTDMCLASLFSGFALANAKLGAVHGLAGPLGGVITGAHGAICASLLPHVMETNVETLRMRAGDSPALVRYNHLARILTRNPSARAENGISWVKNLCQALNIPPLSQLGLTKTDWATVVTKSQSASSMQGNPIRLTAEELLEILRKAI
jgi:alcohol dehydrogenase class IV